MKITADLSKGILIADSVKMQITCKVRTLKDGTRKEHEVIRSIPDGLPYDPKPFPKGLWNITAVEWNEAKTVEGKEVRKFDKWEYGLVKIRTDARQLVNVWELDQDGDYLRETERQVKDSGYLIHYSESGTTLGCIRAGTQDDINIIAKCIQKTLEKGEAVQLEVV